MIVEVFSKVVKDQQAACTSMLVDKGAEYAVGNDMLHNFKISAVMYGCTPRIALGGMMVKHTTSIYDMIKSDKDFSMEKWDEKITDHLNYLLLLKAIIVEEKSHPTS